MNPAVLYCRLQSRRRVLTDLLNLASRYYATDMRPLLYDVDARTIVRLGPEPCPLFLQHAIADERAAIALLDADLHRARTVPTL